MTSLQGREIFLVRGAKALAKGDLGLNFLARGILESAFL
jgi:hypothetical protein